MQVNASCEAVSLQYPRQTEAIALQPYLRSCTLVTPPQVVQRLSCQVAARPYVYHGLDPTSGSPRQGSSL